MVNFNLRINYLKLRFLCFRGVHNSLPPFWVKLGYSRIKIDHIADSLLKLQIKFGVHLTNVELSQLLTLVLSIWIKYWIFIFTHQLLKWENLMELCQEMTTSLFSVKSLELCSQKVRFRHWIPDKMYKVDVWSNFLEPISQ